MILSKDQLVWQAQASQITYSKPVLNGAMILLFLDAQATLADPGWFTPQKDQAMTSTRPAIEDPLNAFCRDTDAYLEGAAEGPLAGLTFAAKDIFDIAGHVTGGGNPDWKATHEPAQKTAWAVQVLVESGATMVGKTITDELTRGVFGENAHYGTPTNPQAPDRIPGGSSCGSAAAVSGGLVDFALGSDTGGSVRIPASFCGIFGLRPTHGRISVDGMLAQSPSFDTIGWFARNPDIFARVGAVLLQSEIKEQRPRRLTIATDTFQLADQSVSRALKPVVENIASMVGHSVTEKLAPTSLAEWLAQYLVLHNREAWQTVRDWIESANPRLSFWVADRYTRARAITDAQVEAARPILNTIMAHLDPLFADGGIVCLPTAPAPAPPRDHRINRQPVLDRIMTLTHISSATGTPQISLPLAGVNGLPVGLSLLGPPYSDELLIALGREIVTTF